MSQLGLLTTNIWKKRFQTTNHLRIEKVAPIKEKSIEIPQIPQEQPLPLGNIHATPRWKFWGQASRRRLVFFCFGSYPQPSYNVDLMLSMMPSLFQEFLESSGKDPGTPPMDNGQFIDDLPVKS